MRIKAELEGEAAADSIKKWRDDMLAVINENTRKESEILGEVMNSSRSSDDDSEFDDETTWEWKINDPGDETGNEGDESEG